MRYYLIAGERSGDLHASNLVYSIKKLTKKAVFRGMGGDYMMDEGVSLAIHYEKLALMGFVEVIWGFRKVLKTMALIKKDLLDFKPDALILVDYGGFNMKMAKFAKKNGISVHYYIPPKIWAWNQNRAYSLKNHVDHLYSILPFEKEFYQKFDWKIHYVGNPLLDELEKFEPQPFFHQKNSLSYSPIIALLPGSRKQEVSKMLKRMVDLVPRFPNAQFIVAGVKNLNSSDYHLAEKMGIKVIFDQTYDLLHHSNAAIVTSGTATLEAALFRVPQVVVYRTSGISYQIAKRLIRVPYISLVNLIAGKEVVKELIQNDYNSKNLMSELNSILANVQRKAEILDGYSEVREKLGDQKASEETAKLIVGFLKKEIGQPAPLC